MSGRDLSDQHSLFANRSGYLTEEQRAEAQRWRLAAADVGLSLLGVFFLLIAGQFFWARLPEQTLQSSGAAVLFILIGLGLLAAVGSQVASRRRQLMQDLATGAVCAADGRVVWRNRPVAEVAGRSLGPVPGLALGAYRFYYLPQSGYLLSAEFYSKQFVSDVITRLPDEEAKASPTSRQPPATVPNVYPFRDSDLVYNRAHRLSPDQKKWLRHRSGRSLQLAVTAVVGLGFTLWLLPKLADLGLCLGLAGIVFFSAQIYFTLVRPWLELSENYVSQHDGEAQREPPETPGSPEAGPEYYCYFGARLFPVSAETYHDLVDGAVYRVYHLGSSGRLMSLERIPKPAAEMPEGETTNG